MASIIQSLAVKSSYKDQQYPVCVFFYRYIDDILIVIKKKKKKN